MSQHADSLSETERDAALKQASLILLKAGFRGLAEMVANYIVKGSSFPMEELLKDYERKRDALQ